MGTVARHRCGSKASGHDFRDRAQNAYSRHRLALHDDLNPFYLAMENDPEFSWIGVQGAGRLLRSPTVYEDLVKMICTTNCSWALTLKMVNGIVDNLGRESNDARKSFPNAAVMAS